MWRPDARPNPEDVGCEIWKPCERRCELCETCRQFELKLRDLLPNDVESKLKRHTFEWTER
jgi:hypothetical protein